MNTIQLSLILAPPMSIMGYDCNRSWSGLLMCLVDAAEVVFSWKCGLACSGGVVPPATHPFRCAMVPGQVAQL